jgi:hypothetical protein
VTTANDIVGEIEFAPTGFDTFFGLQYINTIHSELDQDDPNYNVSRYDISSSLVKLQILSNPSQGNVVLLFKLNHQRLYWSFICIRDIKHPNDFVFCGLYPP